MSTLKHYVDGTEYSSITEVLREMRAGEVLGYKFGNTGPYTGTAIYGAMFAIKHKFGEPIVIGSTNYFPKQAIVTAVDNYINRNNYKQDVSDVIRLVRANPSAARKVLAILG